jgi:hypothetical protein
MSYKDISSKLAQKQQRHATEHASPQNNGVWVDSF